MRQSAKDKVTLIGAGVTLHNCLAAADSLAAKKIPARVIDLYSVKPVDVRTLREAAMDPAPRVAHLAVRDLPTSGKPEELENAAGISARHIVAAATKLVAAK